MVMVMLFCYVTYSCDDNADGGGDGTYGNDSDDDDRCCDAGYDDYAVCGDGWTATGNTYVDCGDDVDDGDDDEYAD